QGEFSVKLSEIPNGKYVERLDGGVEIERVAAWQQVTSEGKTDDDYPSAAVAKDGTAYVAFTSYTVGIDRDERARNWENDPGDLSFLSKTPGGDQLKLVTVKGVTPSQPLAVTESGCDIYKSAVAVAGDGTVWIFWAQNKNYKPFPNNPTSNFDIWARPLTGGNLGAAVKISE